MERKGVQTPGPLVSSLHRISTNLHKSSSYPLAYLLESSQVEESDMNLIDGIFKSFDADGSGSIDADDIRHMHAAKMARTREEMSSGLRERNADGSSSSTY